MIPTDGAAPGDLATSTAPKDTTLVPGMSGPRQSITACLIVRDEEERLPAALASLSWCDEIVVVDSGSTDRTVEIAEAHGARVVEREWRGFGAQRNICLDLATSTWVIEVDADERVSPELHTDIERFLVSPPGDVDICMLARRDWFLGRPLGPSTKYPCYFARLFRRGSYRHDERLFVHEGLWPRGRTIAMAGDLNHDFASTWREAVTDWWNYAQLEARNTPVSTTTAARRVAVALRPLAKVVFRLVVHDGWRDGWRGVVRIGLEATSDGLVIGRRALGLVPGAPPVPPGAQGPDAGGPIRIVVVDPGTESLPFLRAARASGADVALLTDVEVDEGDWLHVQRVPHMRPLAIARGLDAIAQMRPVDLLVVGCARVPRRLLPVVARGVVPPVKLADADASRLTAGLRRAR